jgi:hypothetical protein
MSTRLGSLRAIMAFVAASGLAVAGCGGSGDDAPAAPAPAPAPVAVAKTCAELSAYLTAQEHVSEVATVFQATGTSPRCEVTFAYSGRGGPDFGYADGQQQRVVLRVGLPLNAKDGGAGGGNGAWNGKVRNLGGGGMVGSVGAITAATDTGYVGSSTDSGHTSGENPGFGVIQATHQLNYGKIEDFFSESLRLQYQWALKLAEAYYGTPATRNYWDGCSTGGRQGLVLASKYGNDFDGFLIGAPHTSHTKTSAAAVWRQWVNKDIAGGTVTDAKQQAAVNAAVSACDALDGVVDGILNDPRQCHFSATANICGQPGAPGAPTCLTPGEAKAIDMVWDGARNDHGTRVWLSGGRAALNSMVVGDNCGAALDNNTRNNAIMCWIQKDMTSDWRSGPLSNWDDLMQLGTNTLSPYIDFRDFTLDLVKSKGGKILMWEGGADPLINYQQNTYYYQTVASNYGGVENLKPWFRFFLAPGVGHCSGGVGPNPVDPFQQMVTWAESGKAPDSIPASGGGRTRPLCAWPQTAIYNGSGSTNDAANFHCGGDVDSSKATRCQNYLIAKYQRETASDYQATKLDDPADCGPGELGPQ